MARKQNNTPKKVAKKRATMKKADPHTMRAKREGIPRKTAKSPNLVAQCGGVASCVDSDKPFKPIDENSPEFMYGVSRGVDVARKRFAELDEKCPWRCYQNHKQNAIDIRARLADLEEERVRLNARLREECAKRDGYRLMVQSDTNPIPLPMV